mmetsp:Transcript_48680/g.95434  ORF Transcript_48680/g.95434 Transcript_48680/m.95434 type:complete len:211 (+) Transcript_48680:541-1173(+)
MWLLNLIFGSCKSCMNFMTGIPSSSSLTACCINSSLTARSHCTAMWSGRACAEMSAAWMTRSASCCRCFSFFLSRPWQLGSMLLSTLHMSKWCDMSVARMPLMTIDRSPRSSSLVKLPVLVKAVSGAFSSEKVVKAWWFSSTDMSLYLMARWVCVSTSNRLLLPGWSMSWHRAPISSASTSMSRNRLTTLVLRRQKYANCSTIKPWYQLW